MIKTPLGSQVGNQNTQKGGANTRLTRPYLPIWSPCGPISSAFSHSHWLTSELWLVISKICVIGHQGHQESLQLPLWKLTSRDMAQNATSPYVLSKDSRTTLYDIESYLIACWSPSKTCNFSQLFLIYIDIVHICFPPPVHVVFGNRNHGLQGNRNQGLLNSVTSVLVHSKCPLSTWWFNSRMWGNWF